MGSKETTALLFHRAGRCDPDRALLADVQGHRFPPRADIFELAQQQSQLSPKSIVQNY